MFLNLTKFALATTFLAVLPAVALAQAPAAPPVAEAPAAAPPGAPQYSINLKVSAIG